MKTYVSATPLSEDLKNLLDNQATRKKLVDMLLRRGHSRDHEAKEQESFDVAGHTVTVSSGSPIVKEISSRKAGNGSY